MAAGEGVEKRRAHSRLGSIALLCVVCIALNVLGSQLSVVLKLPVYLDSLGTVLASMLGGYVPGIIVGYLTNIILSFSDSTMIYYGIVNVLVAIVTAYLAKRGWFKKLPMTIVAILILDAISGFLGGLMAYFLNGTYFGQDMSAVFARQLYSQGLENVFGALVCAELFINFVDKTLVVLFATLIYHMIPEELLARLDFTPWQQAPLTSEQLEATLQVKSRRASLNTKFVILVAAIMAFIAVATTALSYLMYHQSVIEAESAKAQGIVDLMAQKVDPNRIDEFISEGEGAPGYRETEKEIAKIRDSFEEVQYAYVYQIKEDGCHVVFDPDTAEEPGSDPGDVVEFDETFEPYLPTLLAGGAIDPIVSNDKYGWLLTVYSPLKDSSGNTACYLAVDVSMAHLVADEATFAASIATLFAAFFILVCAVVLWLARYNITLPVNSIARASGDFKLDNESARNQSIGEIKSLEIGTGDEIENLYDAVNQMSQDAALYVADAQEKSETIVRMQDNLIMVMADLVEGRDKHTGDHVRNTAAYARLIMNQMRREGIHSETLTNEFISNVYKSAPLHDVGKIIVSDVILNKPGKLTDEEFETMKQHAVAGKEILEGAKGAVSESSYLDEAQNLAAYHHEKWDGSGYPFAMVGEDIPLSARIMAVADVFDALVSKRSYKEPFPVDKAFAIIEEGIGTHFDPQVARAFLHARDKARIIAEKSNEKRRLEEEKARAEAEKAEAERAEAEKAEVEKADAAQAQAEKAEAEQADAAQAEAKPAETEQAEAGKPEAEKADAAQAQAESAETDPS